MCYSISRELGSAARATWAQTFSGIQANEPIRTRPFPPHMCGTVTVWLERYWRPAGRGPTLRVVGVALAVLEVAIARPATDPVGGFSGDQVVIGTDVFVAF